MEMNTPRDEDERLGGTASDTASKGSSRIITTSARR
jgi:hypothetical protein